MDESDLLALLEDEGYEAECDCEVKCEAGEVNTCLLYTSRCV